PAAAVPTPSDPSAGARRAATRASPTVRTPNTANRTRKRSKVLADDGTVRLLDGLQFSRHHAVGPPHLPGSKVPGGWDLGHYPSSWSRLEDESRKQQPVPAGKEVASCSSSTRLKSKWTRARRSNCSPPIAPRWKAWGRWPTAAAKICAPEWAPED